ncbi:MULTISPECIES: DNA repair protein RadA [unclassified Bartonella]|uniref:DNA repair protein RadA n=1 Tax=Bartonella TaxID=773 RepID=UPI00099AC56C|nr:MULTISPECIES: DNA repair protein RadA [unclassified Bartonella]AQX18550.1 DNA replication and repair protein RadA [Bartonella sp. A1379B]AQX23064.1 DNA repair protein RadA/Sms [Bartonella sp. 11B]AQX23639.1 DNA repair protein RadA/Sms [Bartonella sp. 114]AQX25519.1 DNA replication and repair protein RadA [Bartonella sp. Coyote22sub2]
MVRNRLQFICQDCGTVHSRWAGKCHSCGNWNSLTEEGTNSGVGSGPPKNIRKGHIVTLTSLSGDIENVPRIHSGIAELDRVTGGGFVRGSALLIAGDPGIGKSTLLTQTAAALSQKGYNVIYVSGEEAITQIRLRAQRLNATNTAVQLAAETNVEDILATLNTHKKLDMVIVDSIQTLWSNLADSAPGTVTQVRISAQAMIHFAKNTGVSVVLVGHVTKDGQIAGPRVVEHMVDGVFYFEGEGGHHYRILRTMKNRFGPTDEIGVFEMSDRGLREISNPSELFLGERNEKAPGAAVFAGMEGTRPILVEIQALVAHSSLGMPRRAVVGWDGNRLSMILAVLEAHCGIRFGQHDVYLNVAGGYRISEPAADLAVAAALVSSLANIPLPTHYVYFGEVSLSGAIRSVAHSGQRIKEAKKLGFQGAFQPITTTEIIKSQNFQQHTFSDLPELIAAITSDEKRSVLQKIIKEKIP